MHRSCNQDAQPQQSLRCPSAPAGVWRLQVLAQQARETGLVIEASNAAAQSAARAAAIKKKRDPGYSADISSIHRCFERLLPCPVTVHLCLTLGQKTQPVCCCNVWCLAAWPSSKAAAAPVRSHLAGLHRGGCCHEDASSRHA